MSTYIELKEKAIKEWDGTPFNAYCSDNPNWMVSKVPYRIVGFSRGEWIDDAGESWTHTYPVEWNKDKVEESYKPKPRRMTECQLSMWLAKGNGIFTKAEFNHLAFASHNYVITYADTEVPDGWKVRKWDSTEWVEPTTDLLEDC